MLYQITAPPTAALDKQADELGRLLKHSKTLTFQFVTVAGSYKPARARLALLSAPDRFAEQATRVMAVLTGCEDAARQSQAVKMRPEWKNVALLLPTDPDAPAIDGRLLDGWDSAFLSVSYRPGRALGRLVYCAEDSARVAGLKLDGWRIIARPNPLQVLANAAGQRWNGVPSFVPVPGGVSLPAASDVAATKHDMSPANEAPAPIHEPVKAALTESADGFLLGVAPDGSAVRLAHRAMTLAVDGPQEARQRAVLALLRRGMQAGMGVLVMVDRTLLPAEALQAWEARVRLLDVQNIADSSAIPWREIAPDLLAQAIAGPSASLPALPSRFGAVLDALGAGALRVPAVLGLAAMPGDNLRGALAAGGMVVVPQDGDAASTIVARLLMAYLATPPTIGRGLLILADPGLVPPKALRQQAIQVVVGARSDAVLQLGATDAGWNLCTPEGSAVAELLPDLMTQPAESAGDMVDSIVQDIGSEGLDAPVVAGLEQAALIAMPILVAVEEAPALVAADELIDVDEGWWSAGERIDDLETADEEPSGGIGATAIEDVPGADLAEEPAGDLDMVLASLLHALMTDAPMDATEELIQAVVAGEDFAAADAAALAWRADAPWLARPWLWQVVLAEEDIDRAIAAWRAMQIDPNGAYAPLARAVLDALGAVEPAAWLASIGGEVPAELIDEETQPDDLSASDGLIWEQDQAGLQEAADLPNVTDWPITFAGAPTLVEEGGSELPSAENWDVQATMPIAAHGLPGAVHAGIASLVAAKELHEEATGEVRPPAAEAPASAPAVAPAQAATMSIAASEDLSDGAIRAIWKSGESVPQLVARLVAGGIDAPTARARVRAIVGARPPMMAADMVARPDPGMSAIAAPATRIQAPAIPPEGGVSSNITAMSMAPLVSESMTPADSMIGSSMPIMSNGEIDDAGIWQLWQAGTKTDDMVLAICGKRGGPKADAARDRIYGAVIPQIVADLNCGDLLDRIAAGEPVTNDPRYSELMKQLARSEHVPVGNLERSLIKRLLGARQER